MTKASQQRQENQDSAGIYENPTVSPDRLRRLVAEMEIQWWIRCQIYKSACWKIADDPKFPAAENSEWRFEEENK